MIGLSPQEISELVVATNATSATAPRGSLRNPGQPMRRAPDQRCRCHYVAADDHHYHLHGERHQRPKVFTRFETELDGTLARDYAQSIDHQHAQESEYQWTREPSFAPAARDRPMRATRPSSACRMTLSVAPIPFPASHYCMFPRLWALDCHAP